MFHLRLCLQTVLALMFLTTAAVSAPARNPPDRMSWYTGGKAKLHLDQIPAETSSSVVFAGTTTQKDLLVKVDKKGEGSRSSHIPLAADGSFNVRYLIKDGIGPYTISFFGSEQNGSSKFQGLGFLDIKVNEITPADQPDLELNSKMIEFVDQVMGTTVGRGECWDLAQEGLDKNLADWTRPLSFGLPLNPKTDEIKAGDIIQFRTLKTIERLPNKGIQTETFGLPDHTAVIYKVLGKNNYTLAHQNINGKRSVIKSNVNLAHVTSGQYWIYRPVALMVRQEVAEPQTIQAEAENEEPGKPSQPLPQGQQSKMSSVPTSTAK